MEIDVHALGRLGYVVGEGFLGPQLLTLAADGARGLIAEGALAPAGVGRGAGHLRSTAIRGDRICWLEPTGPLAAVWSRFEALRHHLNREAFLGLSAQELQLAWYPGGGTFYARHRDAFVSGPGRPRRITAIVYLNRAWTAEEGGLLRLHVEPTPVDVAPTADRFVLFRSELVEHEVLPAHGERLALTAWFS